MTEPVQSAPEGKVIFIRPRSGWVRVDLRELWEYRELLWVLASRDIRVRYKQTLLGVAWAVLQPTAAAAAFTLFFGHFAQIPSDGAPYALFAFAALVPWTYFAQALSGSAGSLVEHRAVITKIYFPRLLLPLAPLLAGLLDFALAMALLFMALLAHGRVPQMGMLALPAFLGLTVMTALGTGLWLAALSALYRDFRHVVPFLLQLWLFASPIAYPASIVPERWRLLYGLNPMVGAIEGFRWALLGTTAPRGELLAASALTALLLLLTGAAAFRRLERTFVDVV
ncbi:MAG: ABC transporter permease [Myxococcales bacterium]|nr:ABC transporter permease [Myxococcales bacterium]